MTSSSNGAVVRYARRAVRIAVWMALLSGLALIMAAGVLIAQSCRMADDAPLARMYRAETDLTALGRAVEMYHRAYGVYPAAGPEGLKAAVATFSQRAAYFGSGPPDDPWGRPYVYIPNTAYDEYEDWALRDEDGAYRAPDTFQLYCLGADGRAGEDDAIVYGDRRRPWRSLYRRRQQTD